MTPVHVRDLIMARQPLVDERVVGRQELDDAAIAADLAGKEHFRLSPECLAEVLVEIRKQIRARRSPGQRAERQPLTHKVLDEPAGAPVGQHSWNLLSCDWYILQRAIFPDVQ